jgi:hypothetical protein
MSHPNWLAAWTVLSTVENLKEVHEFVAATAGDDTGDGRMFQHILVRQGANALESLYWLTKHHQYNSARGRCRYLYETYLVLKGLNRDQERAAEKWDETREEARERGTDKVLKPLEKQTQALHDFRKEERKRVEREFGETDVYKDFWRLLSDRGSHPTSIRGSMIDERSSVESEDSLFRTGLVLVFGIAAQYIRTFAGTPTRWRVQKRVDPIIVEIKLAMQPYGLPTFLEEEVFFWDPTLRRSPFVGQD